MGILVDHSARIADQLAELTTVQAGAVDGGDVPGQGRPLITVEAADLRYNPLGEWVSGIVRERVIPAFVGKGVSESQLDLMVRRLNVDRLWARFDWGRNTRRRIGQWQIKCMTATLPRPRNWLEHCNVSGGMVSPAFED